MKKPTESDWAMMVFCQTIAQACRKSDNLRVPSDPNWALEQLRQYVERSQRQEGVA